jgi:ferrous iron transport protein A
MLTMTPSHDHYNKRLSEISTGGLVTLTSIQVGLELTSRMTSLGLTPGVSVNVLQNNGRGPIIINVRGTHVALGRGEADKLLVESIGEA